MSTVDQPPRITSLPRLVAGQRLDQPTFHERYEAMPPETQAELIGGIVYMTPPHRARSRSDPHGSQLLCRDLSMEHQGS